MYHDAFQFINDKKVWHEQMSFANITLQRQHIRSFMQGPDKNFLFHILGYHAKIWQRIRHWMYNLVSKLI